MDKIVIITGGASGLGLELVKIFNNKGYLVCNIDKDASALSKVQIKNNYKAFIGDVSNEILVKEMINEIGKLGTIVALINCAGTPSFKMPTDYTSNDVDLCFEGLKGMIYCSTQVLKLIEKTGGKIINIMSSVPLEEISKKLFTVQLNGRKEVIQKV